ncbi:uncharacterized protein [Rutidosis leptorrhynchoides]|uniref:uncharacterized protein n=1 Tax=Rutidosis leptorrhynchoides TaxID=125765 RepID=UPI003A996DDF
MVNSSKKRQEEMLNLFKLHFLLLFFSFSIPSNVISQNSSSGKEQTILMEIKRQLGNPKSLQHWNSSSSPCHWPEIGCTENSVSVILLKDKEIYTQVPSSICDLQNLLAIDLSYNYIPGKFPRVLYNCSKISYLDLSQNYFVGPIPDDIDRISTLTYIDFSANNFSGNIPAAIGKLSNLVTLYIHQNQFNGTFPKEIGDLANLETLSMAYNGFSPMFIPEEFGQLKKLKFLWIKDANLIGRIPESFSNLKSLDHLDLSINNLEGQIPSQLLTFENLTNLYLFNNRLSGEIPRPITAMKLVEFDVSMNHLSGSIHGEFGKLQSLELLNLFSNRFSGGVPASIGQLPNLTAFRVFDNKLSGSLPPDMGHNMKLEAFEASNNMFTGQLPESLCAGGVLKGVVVFSNNLTGEIPKSLGNCRSLRTVQLHDNKFSGEIPEGLWTTFNLSSLKLSGNSFTGKLPNELARNLSRLEIRNNKFSGPIPFEVASWTKLIVFEASGNRFSGEIPVQMTNLSRLTTLRLDDNQFSGELPSVILSWKSLTTLNLSKNKLCGQIPPSFGSLPDLLYLDLSSNHFKGEIPTEMGNLRLTSLNLSCNQLSGKIPREFNNLAYENSFLNNSNLCANRPILNFPDCETKQSNSKHVSLAIIATLAVAVALITVLILSIMIRYCRSSGKIYGGDNTKTWKLTRFHELRFDEKTILSNLTESNLIGSGGSGKVYRIPIDRNGDSSVAVKKIWNIKKLDSNLKKEFTAEVQILGTIRHLNVVKLLCCISSEKSKLLVYEYMDRHSLDRWLHNGRSSTNSVHNFSLEWPTRLNIAIGAAQGLCYMHHDCSPPILHRDVKSSNILLDSEFKAKIADFGLAKIFLAKDAMTMSAVAGSFGYLAPEYAYTTKVNEKIDVYSFGVVLLELVTGRKPKCGDENTNLAEWAWCRYTEEMPIVDVLDPDVKEAYFLEDMTNVFKLGLVCTSTMPSSRPSMKEVLRILRRCEASRQYKEMEVG